MDSRRESHGGELWRLFLSGLPGNECWEAEEVVLTETQLLKKGFKEY